MVAFFRRSLTISDWIRWWLVQVHYLSSLDSRVLDSKTQLGPNAVKGLKAFSSSFLSPVLPSWLHWAYVGCTGSPEPMGWLHGLWLAGLVAPQHVRS